VNSLRHTDLPAAVVKVNLHSAALRTFLWPCSSIRLSSELHAPGSSQRNSTEWNSWPYQWMPCSFTIVEKITKD